MHRSKQLISCIVPLLTGRWHNGIAVLTSSTEVVIYGKKSFLQFLIFLQLVNSLEIALHAAIYLFILQNCLVIAHKYVNKFQLCLFVIYSLPTPNTLNPQSLWLDSSLRPLIPMAESLQLYQSVTGCTLEPTFTVPATSLGTWVVLCAFPALLAHLAHLEWKVPAG